MSTIYVFPSRVFCVIAILCENNLRMKIISLEYGWPPAFMHTSYTMMVALIEIIQPDYSIAGPAKLNNNKPCTVSAKTAILYQGFSGIHLFYLPHRDLVKMKSIDNDDDISTNFAALWKLGPFLFILYLGKRTISYLVTLNQTWIGVDGLCIWLHLCNKSSSIIGGIDCIWPFYYLDRHSNSVMQCLYGQCIS